jgi:hypothetical protein
MRARLLAVSMPGRRQNRSCRQPDGEQEVPTGWMMPYVRARPPLRAIHWGKLGVSPCRHGLREFPTGAGRAFWP